MNSKYTGQEGSLLATTMKVAVGVAVLLVILVECGSDTLYHTRNLLQTQPCSNQTDCLPLRYINTTTVVPPNLVDCISNQCICQDCFMRSGSGRCSLRECRDYTTGGGCEDDRRSQLTALLLSIFLSGVGAANFYIERNGLAAGQLVLFLIILFSSCAVCCPLCCVCCAGEKKSTGILTAYFCFITVLVVLASLAQTAWWIADLVIFANNDRDDGDGCMLKPI